MTKEWSSQPQEIPETCTCPACHTTIKHHRTRNRANIETLAFIELKPLGFAALNENDMPATRAFERLGDRSNGCAKRLLLKRPYHLSAREPMENIHTIHRRQASHNQRSSHHRKKTLRHSRPGPCIIAKYVPSQVASSFRARALMAKQITRECRILSEYCKHTRTIHTAKKQPNSEPKRRSRFIPLNIW
jgi:hypothetical protein